MKTATYLTLTAALALGALALPARAQDLATAVAALKSGDCAKAAQAAEAVPSSAADYAKAQFVAGEAHLALGDAALAETSFRNVLTAKPAAVPAQDGLGRAVAAQLVAAPNAQAKTALTPKVDESKKALKALVTADPKDSQSRFAYGELLLASGELEPAVAVLEEAHTLDPKHALIARSLFDAYLASNAEEPARRLANDVAKKLSKHPVGPFLQAVMFEREGKDEKAIESYEECLKRDDTFLDAHKNLAILCHTRNPLYQDMERTKKALEHYKRYYELGGRDESLRPLYEQMKGFLEKYLK